MIDILIDLLTPIFISMGASAADVANYMRSVSEYIYVILGALAVLVIIMIGAQFVVKKGSRGIVRFTALIAFVLVVLVTVNMVCYGPLYATISGVLNASRAEISDDVAGNSRETVVDTAREGMVLVKNDGLLPLSSDTTALNVFGWASAFPVFSGTGSAASGDGSDSVVTLYDGLTNAGYTLNEELVTLYQNYSKGLYDSRPTINMTTQDWTLPEPTPEYYTEALMTGAKNHSDVAVIVIGRSGGENADLPTDMAAVIDGTWNIANSDAVQSSVAHNYNYVNGVFYNNNNEKNKYKGYDEFEEGEHYLELSKSEENLVDLVCSNFDNVIVVINANNTMELSWVDEYDSIGAVILAPGPGDTGFNALGEIINGTVNPSGKTADTYVRDLTDTVTWNHSGNSGNNLYTNVSDLTKMLAREDNTFNGVISFVDYVEGIYMGYKYYETASDEGVIDYYEKVQYPFGYGLSYTTFSQEITKFQKSDDMVIVEVTVTNTGSVAGKDVVELYYTPPYTNGGIEKASVNLIDFEKTDVLEPGASQKVTFTVVLEDMASYDSSCIKTANGGYMLEAGEYVLSIRSDSHNVIDSESFTLDSDIDYSVDGRASDGLTAVNQFPYMESDHTILSRANKFANYAEAAAAPSADECKLSKDDQNLLKDISILRYDPEDYDNAEDVMPTTGVAGELTLIDMVGKPYDDESWELLLNQMSIDEMVTLINTGGWGTTEIASVGKIATSECDGPSGLSNYVTGASGTQFSTEVLMAQTWSKQMADQIGDAMGQEFANAENFGWYGPAMNLHRTAFSGRNFEYYSEDAVLSGIFASYEVNSAAKYGVYSYLKHFAGNDQETNRTAFLMTYMTEQTFRETCLKPFEMVVKNFDFDNYVMGMMASYNFLGYKPTSSCYELLTTVLRDEWGFVGTVISDYNGSYGYQITDASIRAGCDLMLGYGKAASNKMEDTEAATCVLAMRQACKNILYTTANSGYYYGEVELDGPSNMDNLFSTVNIAVGAACAVLELLAIVVWLLKKRKAAAK